MYALVFVFVLFSPQICYMCLPVITYLISNCPTYAMSFIHQVIVGLCYCWPDDVYVFCSVGLMMFMCVHPVHLGLMLWSYYSHILFTDDDVYFSLLSCIFWPNTIVLSP
jgi:hypothetical protein